MTCHLSRKPSDHLWHAGAHAKPDDGLTIPDRLKQKLSDPVEYEEFDYSDTYNPSRAVPHPMSPARVDPAGSPPEAPPELSYSDLRGLTAVSARKPGRSRILSPKGRPGIPSERLWVGVAKTMLGALAFAFAIAPFVLLAIHAYSAQGLSR